jgi:beta-glucosidase-like glycosyl hydrolase
MSDLPPYKTVSKAFSLRQKAGQLFMPAAFINDTEPQIRALEALIRDGQAGGLCFFHSRAGAAANFEGRQKVPYNRDSLSRLRELITRYQGAAPCPLLVAIDAEWGLAMRVEHAPRYPYALALGALQPESEHLLHDLGLRMAQDCREVGIHMNLAPVADINTNPDNPVIGYRAFGSDPGAVGRKAVLLHKGLADGGLLSCAKHFPGHGDTSVDSHLDLPVVKKRLSDLEQGELLPFRALIEAEVPAVMTGHLSLPELDASGLPASLSKTVISLLREMGFRGTVLTDAMNMYALRGIAPGAEFLNLMALEAGNDMLCFPDRIPESIDLLLKEMDPSRIEASFRRIWDLKERGFLGVHGGTPAEKSPGALNRELARHCLSPIGLTERTLAQFRKGGVTCLSVGPVPGSFFESLKVTMDFELHQSTEGAGFQDLFPGSGRNILLALSPPSMKPKNCFGLPETLPGELASLASRHRVLLYLFGNPYLLQHLPVDLLEGILCAFQPLPEFQVIAAEHFEGRCGVSGTLPITLKHGR